jgi:predicted heme/steroid binding protein
MDATPPVPLSEETSDLGKAIATLQRQRSLASELAPPSQQSRGHTGQTTSTRRALMHTALGSLLIAGVFAALNFGNDDAHRVATLIPAGREPSAGGQANVVFSNARSGDCLTWPPNSPNQPSFVQCSDDHLFEVVESADMRNFEEPCQLAVRRYLGSRYDPNSKFTINVLWSGDAVGTQSEQHLLCGLQLPGPDNQPITFKGHVAELDQSKVWPAGTCLGIDSATNQPTEIPVDCSAPHAVEVTAAVNVAEKFPGAPPGETDQDAFLRDACARAADVYLSPVVLNSTGLTLIYSTVPLPSWLAGSHQVSCGIGATLGNRGWATLIGSAKGRLMINGQASPAPLNIPDTRQDAPRPPDQRPNTPPTPVGTTSPV